MKKIVQIAFLAILLAGCSAAPIVLSPTPSNHPATSTITAIPPTGKLPATSTPTITLTPTPEMTATPEIRFTQQCLLIDGRE